MDRAEVYHGGQEGREGASRSVLLGAALKYAGKGIPVFPCEAGGKKPLVKWRDEATTNPSRITAWWNRYPEANIGIPTGRASGLLVLDEDRDGALSELPEELPETTRVRTGSGGVHVYLKYPEGAEVRNSASKIAEGLDVRGEGGYIIAPPSHTSGPYKTLDRLPLSDAPAWLSELLRSPHRPDERRPSRVSRIDAGASGPGIGEGCRNDELARIAGRLHDGRSLEELEDSLIAVNEARCVPPLPDAEVIAVARSIHRMDACKPNRKASPEVLAELAELEEANIAGRNWPGLGGKTDRDVYISILTEARRFGEIIPAGVRVTFDIRSLALKAAVSKTSVIKAVRRLREAGLLRRDDAERSRRQAGAFVLLAMRARVDHSVPSGFWPDGSSGKGWRAFTAPRLRWSAPVIVVRDVNESNFEGGTAIRRDGNMITYRLGTIRRLGKTCGSIVDYLESAGGSMDLEDLYAALYPEKDPTDRKRWRPRELHRRNLPRLAGAGVVSVVGDTVNLTHEWLDALNEEREDKGEVSAYRRDLARYDREREQHRKDLGIEYERPAHAKPPPSDGLISDLQPIPEEEPEPSSPVSDSPGQEDSPEGSTTREPVARPQRAARYGLPSPTSVPPTSATLIDFWAVESKAAHYADAIELERRKGREHRSRLAAERGAA